VIRSSVDLGVAFFDTAEVYGPFTNEVLVHPDLQGRKSVAVVILP
jgi:aryl-alcohol dehydrogenase-like predicted oxidoreductase